MSQEFLETFKRGNLGSPITYWNLRLLVQRLGDNNRIRSNENRIKIRDRRSSGQVTSWRPDISDLPTSKVFQLLVYGSENLPFHRPVVLDSFESNGLQIREDNISADLKAVDNGGLAITTYGVFEEEDMS